MSLSAFELYHVKNKLCKKVWSNLLRGRKLEIKNGQVSSLPGNLDKITSAPLYFNPKGNNLLLSYFSAWSSKIYNTIQSKKTHLGDMSILSNNDGTYDVRITNVDINLPNDAQDSLEKIVDRIHTNPLISNHEIIYSKI
tara:strand:- start:371 stop:787 length:417 start_codon:yes stop_codon:yes gene_type:complete